MDVDHAHAVQGERQHGRADQEDEDPQDVEDVLEVHSKDSSLTMRIFSTCGMDDRKVKMMT
jgi:hypothetical protein